MGYMGCLLGLCSLVGGFKKYTGRIALLNYQHTELVNLFGDIAGYWLRRPCLEWRVI